MFLQSATSNGSNYLQSYPIPQAVSVIRMFLEQDLALEADFIWNALEILPWVSF